MVQSSVWVWTQLIINRTAKIKRGSRHLTKTLMGNSVLRGLLNGSSVEVSEEIDEGSHSQSTNKYPVLSLLTSFQVIKKMIAGHGGAHR